MIALTKRPFSLADFAIAVDGRHLSPKVLRAGAKKMARL